MKIGVVGTGYLGRLHARVLTEMPEVSVEGFIEPNDAIANELSSSLGRTRIHTHETPEQAWRAAWSQAGPTDGIVIAGSVFLAGELRPLLLRDCRPV